MAFPLLPSQWSNTPGDCRSAVRAARLCFGRGPAVGRRRRRHCSFARI